MRRPPVRSAGQRALRSARRWRPVRHSALRELYEHPAPPPGDFARHGEGSWLVPPCHITGAADIAVGDGVVILEHADLRVVGAATGTPRLVLHDGVRLTRFVSIVCEVGVVLEAGVASSDCITILDTWGDAGEPAPVRVGRGAYLGYGCTVLPGVTVGAGAFVGEGAVVVEDVPEHTVVYGNPARVVRRYLRDTGAWEGPQWP